MTKFLPENLCDKIQELRDLAYDREEAGDFEGAEQLHLKAWGLVPDPKLDWADSLRYADSIAEFYLDAGKLKQSLVFSTYALDCEIEDFDFGPFINAGKVNYELENFDDALKHFSVAFERGGKRAFVNEDAKYFVFFSNKKAS